MKRRWIALFLAVVLMASMVPGALAATVENDNAAWSGNVSTPGVNSDPVAQAEMLRQLGLFLGTDKGFELDQPYEKPASIDASNLVLYLIGVGVAAGSSTVEFPT